MLMVKGIGEKSDKALRPKEIFFHKKNTYLVDVCQKRAKQDIFSYSFQNSTSTNHVIQTCAKCSQQNSYGYNWWPNADFAHIIAIMK